MKTPLITTLIILLTIDLAISQTLDNRTRWLNYHQLKISDFTPKQTKALEVMDLGKFDSVSQHSKLYEPFYIHSPKRTKFLDLDSYSLSLEEVDNQLMSDGGSVDTEVALIVRNEQRKYRLGFFGSIEIIEEAYWDSESVMYVFLVSTESDLLTRIFIKYDLEKKTKTLYTSPPVKEYRTTYNEEIRLKKIIFK